MVKTTFSTTTEMLVYYVKNTFYAIINNDIEVFERNENIDFDELMQKLFQMEDEFFVQNPTTSMTRMQREFYTHYLCDNENYVEDNNELNTYSSIDIKMLMYQLLSVEYFHISEEEINNTVENDKCSYLYQIINLNNIYQFLGFFLENTMLIKDNEFLSQLLFENDINLISKLKYLHKYFIKDFYEKIKDYCPICFDKHVLKTIFPCSHKFCGKCIQKIEKCAICRGEIIETEFSYIRANSEI